MHLQPSKDTPSTGLDRGWHGPLRAGTAACFFGKAYKDLFQGHCCRVGLRRRCRCCLRVGRCGIGVGVVVVDSVRFGPLR
jgi:hypothetical protein